MLLTVCEELALSIYKIFLCIAQDVGALLRPPFLVSGRQFQITTCDIQQLMSDKCIPVCQHYTRMLLTTNVTETTAAVANTDIKVSYLMSS